MNDETKLPAGGGGEMTDIIPRLVDAANVLFDEEELVLEAADAIQEARRSANENGLAAIHAQRERQAEHAQRLTLQHHAADQAQQIEDLRFAAEAGGRRIAELEAERDNTAGHIASIARQIGDDALQVDDIAVRVLALVAERDAAQQARRDAQELAERYQDERNKAGAQARREVAEQVRDLTVERDELRARLAAPKVWLAEYANDWHQQGAHYAYTEATDPDASEDWATEDVVKAFVAGAELAERDAATKLAEIEAQEPVAFARYSVHSRKPASVDLVSEYEEWQHDTGLLGDHWGGNEPLYARPVPAAIPTGGELVPVAWLAPAEVSDDWPWPHTFFARDAHPHIRELMGAFPVYSSPVPAQAMPDADGARFRWLCEDHSDRETREQCRSLIDRLSGMSYSAAVMSIDAAMAAAQERKA